MRSCILFSIFIVGFLYSIKVNAQTDSIASGPKNVIKFNITSRMLWGKDNYVFGYERRLKNPYHTINVTFGIRSLPKFINIGKSDSAFIIRNQKNKGGISAAVDYRFYLKKQNVGMAPRGVYFAPFFEYFSNSVSNDLSVFNNELNIENDIKIDTKLKLYSVGFKFGYQFIFWDRLSLDMVLLGPSITSYNANLKLDGTFDPDEDNEIFQKFKNAVVGKYPVLDNFLEDKEITKKGTFSTSTLGFHYSISIGFAF